MTSTVGIMAAGMELKRELRAHNCRHDHSAEAR